MSSLLTITKINNLLLQVKQCLNTHNQVLPIIKCTPQFDIDKKVILRTNPINIKFMKSTITQVLRIVQILTIVKNLLLNNKFITKRNLYYQLVKYYKYYSALNDDIDIICDTLKIQRQNLNIIASSKLQLFWFNVVKMDKKKQVLLELSYKKFTEQQNQSHQTITQSQFPKDTEINTAFIQKQHIKLVSHQIFKIPNCPKLDLNILYPQYLDDIKQKKINFLILQKQSIFQILSQSLTYKLPGQNDNWLLINSQGYPDKLTLQFVNEMFKAGRQNDIQFYYLGDYDVYGVDIMFSYAFGNQYIEGIWSKMKWLCKLDQTIQVQDEKNRGFKKKFEESQYIKQTPEDKKKSQQILNRKYFNFQQLENKFKQYECQEQKQLNQKFIDKMKKWKKIMENMLRNGYHCQVQSYFKHLMYPFDLIQLMVSKKLYV